MKNQFSIILIVFFSILLISGCSDKNPNKKQVPAPGVLIQKVVQKEIKGIDEFIGRTVAVNDVSIQTQVTGYLLETLFEEGADVAIGDELFVINAELYQAYVAEAEADLAKARADQHRAEKDLARYKSLLKSKNISRQQVDVAASEVLQSKAQVKYSRAELQKALLDLSHTRIKSPIKGRIGRKLVSTGNLIDPQIKSLARIVELNPMYINFNISENNLVELKKQGRINNNIEIKLLLYDASLYPHTGSIDFIDNTVDPTTGTVLVRAKIANPDQLLIPGMFVRAQLSREKKKLRLLIHVSAVQEDQIGKFVLLVDADNKIIKRSIKTGKQYGGDIVVLQGLNPDERVVVEGIQKVRPGMMVKPELALLPGDEKVSKHLSKKNSLSPKSTPEKEH